ncbi:hypothetical protein HDU79_009395 [Rhizoclosmatium sp. JEL0117]|nr:hypothetical protein HDU79_009395 [Rhizoclosmatium sp. JEL0117]
MGFLVTLCCWGTPWGEYYAAKTIAEFNRAYIGFSITHILAFDSPFLGVQEHVIGAKIGSVVTTVNDTVTEYGPRVMRLLGSNDTNSDDRLSNTKDSSSSLWTWGVAAGAAVITAAVAYNSKAVSKVTKTIQPFLAHFGPPKTKKLD